MKGALCLLVVLLAVVSHGYCKTEETRNIRLPGLADLVDELKGKIEKALESLTGLTGEQRRQLINEFLASVRNFPNAKGWHTLKPSMMAQYLKEVHEFADNVITTLVEKAKAMIKSNKGEKRSLVDIGERLPGMRDFIEYLQKKFEILLDSVTDLTKEQREELVEEFLAHIRNYPNEMNIQSVKPSEYKKWKEQIDSHMGKIAEDLLEKAKSLVGSKGKRAIPVPQFILDLQAKLVSAFKTAVYTITGLTEYQQEKIVEEFKEGLSKFPMPPLDRPWTAMNPFNWVKYIAEITSYNLELTAKLLDKARKLVSGEDLYPDEDRRRALDFNTILDELVVQFRNMLAHISGLSHEETDALIKEFKDHLKTYPTLPISDWFNLGKVAEYLKQFREFSLKLTSLILEKAKAIVDHRLTIGKTERDIRIPSLDDIINKLKSAFRKALDAVGLTKERTDKIYADFVDFINNFPKISGKDLLNPSKVFEYGKELLQFGRNAIELFLEKAKAFLHIGRETRQIEFKIRLPDFFGILEKQNVPNFDRMLDWVREQVAAMGLTEDEQNFLLNRLRRELNNYPKPPTGLAALNPLRWAQYLVERSTHFKNTIYKALNDADDYIRNKI